MKTRSIVALLLAAWSALFIAGCTESNYNLGPAPGAIHGNGHVVEQTRAIGDVSRVTLQGVGKLYIRQGASPALRVVAEENLLQYLQTEVQGGDLVIWKDGGTLVNSHPIEYHLTVVNLEHVALTGAGWIHGTSLTTGPLTLRLSGVGTVDLVGLNAPGVDVDSSGLGNVILSGSVGAQTIELSSMGTYDGRNLESAEADVLIGDGGSATVRVRDHLNATINGSGSVYYIGDPIIESSGHGSGHLVKLAG